MSDRKKDHITLAFESQTEKIMADTRFYYEPMTSVHQTELPVSNFLETQMRAPIWISSMTGGTAMAAVINKRLAKVAGKFGFGMGLGSCRMLMESNEYFQDFDVRKYIGDELPLYANLGVAQIQEYLETNRIDEVNDLIYRLKANGLIIHVNPLQEAFQPEGDRFGVAPIETISNAIQQIEKGVIVKEVGQGFGPESIKALLKLPLVAIDFGAFGGTNFAKLELLRSTTEKETIYRPLTHVGHTANDMVDLFNNIIEKNKQKKQHNVIISGGIQSYLDGYYLINKIHANAVYGQASAFLKYAIKSEEALFEFARQQVDGLKIAHSFLTIRS